MKKKKKNVPMTTAQDQTTKARCVCLRDIRECVCVYIYIDTYASCTMDLSWVITTEED